jgi:hypothetical protein
MSVAEAVPKPPVIVRAPRCMPAGRPSVSLSIRRMTTSFVGDDPEYAGWLRANPGGFVLNVARRASAPRATLHLAGCAAIRPAVTRTGQSSTMRVCAPSAAALAAWTSTELRRDPARCGRCHP